MNIHEATIANPNTGLVGKNFIAVGREYHNYKVPDSVPEIEMRDPIRYNMAPASFLEVFKQDQAMYNKAFQGPLISALERNGRQDVLDTIRGLEEIPDDDPNDERDGSGLFEGDHVNPRYLRKLIYYNDYAIPYYSSNYPNGYDPQALVNAIDWDRGRGSGYLYAKPDGGSLLSSLGNMGSYVVKSAWDSYWNGNKENKEEENPENAEKKKSNARVIIEGIGDAAVGTIKGVRKGIDLTRKGIQKGVELYEKAKAIPKEYKRNKEIATDTKRIIKDDTKRTLKDWWNDLWKSKDQKKKDQEDPKKRKYTSEETLANWKELVEKGRAQFNRSKEDEEKVREKKANPNYDKEAKMKLSVDPKYGDFYTRTAPTEKEIALRNTETNPLMYSKYDELKDVISIVPKVSSKTVGIARNKLSDDLWKTKYDKLDKVRQKYIREAVKKQFAPEGEKDPGWGQLLDEYLKDPNSKRFAKLHKENKVPNPVMENSEILPKAPLVQTSMDPNDALPADVQKDEFESLDGNDDGFESFDDEDNEGNGFIFKKNKKKRRRKYPPSYYM